MRLHFLEGQTFGRLRVIALDPKRDKKGNRYWRCSACGVTTVVRTDRLTSGNTRSCGCLQEQVLAAHIQVLTARLAQLRERRSRAAPLPMSGD
jgi:hypothetical protein